MLLDGRELAGFIKQRQYQQVRSLQHLPHQPRLAIICCNEEVVSSKYGDIKQNYGADIDVAVDLYTIDSDNLAEQIDTLNKDSATHGIIVQLPLPDGVKDIDGTLSLIDPDKDVDVLGSGAHFLPPTPNAILWLLGGYGIDIADKTVAVIGQGRLVGEPLTRLLRESGQEPLVCDEYTGDKQQILTHADVIISATGQTGLIKSSDIQPGTTVVDAGTASEAGVLKGDVEPAAYERDDINISPVPGGVGPLTVCALFENVLSAFMSQEPV